APVALLRVVRGVLRLETGGAANQPKPALVIARGRPHPRAGDRVAAGGAVSARCAEGAEAGGAHGPRWAVGTDHRRS
ncbi:MAG: hypothetical protein ACK55Z_18845, partial [bacterium]